MTDWFNFDNYTEQGSGGIEAIEAAGLGIREHNRVWECTDPVAAAAIQAAFDPLPWELAQALDRISEWKWKVLNGGHMTALGVAVNTDSTSFTLLTGAFSRANSGAQSVFSFKDIANSWHTIDAATMIAIYNDVAAFIQACFSQEQNLATEASALTDWTQVRIFDHTQGWPS